MAGGCEQMVDSNDAELALRRYTAGLRKTVERLREQCGLEAADILNSALDESERLIQEFFSSSGADGNPATDET